MNTACKIDDMELLLSVHNESSPLKGMAVRRHAKSCPRCQHRIEEFSVVSTTFNELLRPGVTVSTSTFKPYVNQNSRVTLRLVLVGAALAAVAAMAMWAYVANSKSDSHSATSRPLLNPSKSRSNLLGPTPMRKN